PPAKKERRKADPPPSSPPATPLAPPSDLAPTGETAVVSRLFLALGDREPGLVAAAGGFGALALLVGAVTLTSVRKHRSAIGADAASERLVAPLPMGPRRVEPVRAPEGKEVADAGEAVARRARAATIEEALDTFTALGYGDAALTSFSTTEAFVEVGRCSTCLRATGDEPCHFEIGYLRGAFAVAWGTPVTVREVACGRNARPCSFRVVKGQR
ncbi:MAG TPA: 4-vinyl reductase, partial [Candidatus Thermoplasmatota archaeon]|nr:4-vinyl reductase [Candidatus Thermoplasmatota archaeon]